MIIMSIGFLVTFLVIVIMTVLVVVLILLANLENSLLNPDATTHLFSTMYPVLRKRVRLCDVVLDGVVVGIGVCEWVEGVAVGGDEVCED